MNQVLFSKDKTEITVKTNQGEVVLGRDEARKMLEDRKSGKSDGIKISTYLLSYLYHSMKHQN